MIIFESFFTTFEASVIFEAAGAVAKIGASLKPNHHMQFSLPKSVKRSVYIDTFAKTFFGFPTIKKEVKQYLHDPVC